MKSDGLFDGNQFVVDIVFWSLTVAILLLGVTFIPLMILHKHRQPIKARPLGIVVASQICLVIFAVTITLQRIFSLTFPCIATVLFSHIMYIGLTGLYMLRVWLVWFAYKSTREKTKMFSLDVRELRIPQFVGEGNWYLRHQYLASNQFLRWLFFVTWGFISLPFIATLFLHPHIKHETVDACPSIDVLQNISSAWTAFCAVLMVFTAFKFVPLKDAFSIKNELRSTGILTGIILLVWMWLSTHNINYSTFPFSSLLLLLNCFWIFGWSSIYPCYRARTEQKQLTMQRHRSKERSEHKTPELRNGDRCNSDIPISFRELLVTPSELQKFMQQLTEEFCVENLMFYRECEQFQEEFVRLSSQKRLKRAEQMYGRFVVPGAVLQVNVSGRVVKQINQTILTGEIGPDLFDSSKNEVFILMKRGSYVRYVIKRQHEMDCDHGTNLHVRGEAPFLSYVV